MQGRSNEVKVEIGRKQRQIFTETGCTAAVGGSCHPGPMRAAHRVGHVLSRINEELRARVRATTSRLERACAREDFPPVHAGTTKEAHRPCGTSELAK